MPVTPGPDWQQLAIYIAVGAVVLVILTRLPFIGRIVRLAITLGVTALCLFLLLQVAPYQPFLAGITAKLGLDSQEVTGTEVRIRMSSDGHFWAQATIDGAKRRMLVDSGATVTTLSEGTAKAAGIDAEASVVPVVLKTANGLTRGSTATVERLDVGNISARDLKVVVSPAIGDLDVIGMNFLSRLKSWRVEGRTLILVPHHPQPQAEEKKAA
jgi:aspartyl protease family protein